MRWLGGITDSTDISLSKFQQTVKDREAWHAAGPWDPKDLDTTWQRSNSDKMFV